METTPGYIYVRNHPSYDEFNACKMGKATNIPDRDAQYATGEIRRGYFEAVFKVSNEIMATIERLLQNEFRELNIRYDAGTEFYDKQIITLIEPYLIKLGIKYEKLSKEEINDLTRCNRVNITKNKLNIKEILPQNTTVKQTSAYVPRDYQTLIINKSVEHFQHNDKGLLVLICGVGKTLLSLWITLELKSNTILIGVPNTMLLGQWENDIRMLFNEGPYLTISSGVNTEMIKTFLNSNRNRCIIITTYSSVHKVYNVANTLNFKFDMKILDEVHHLTSRDINLSHITKKYIQILNIQSVKQISLTATLKQLECGDDISCVVSNDNTDYFGNVIDKKGLLWAINKNIICDYVIQTIVANEEQLNTRLEAFPIADDTDMRLFLSAYASLKSIAEGHSHHLLIYGNSKDNTSKIIKYIKMLLDNKFFHINDLYYSYYHSKDNEMTTKKQMHIIDSFEKATAGIITCVYCLGEGWDFPLLDGVVFAENMTSNIRIVQSALRAGRKYKNQPDKRTKIILPVLNRDDWLENGDNTDFKKVSKVIYELGLEDKTIAHKIKVSFVDIKKTPVINSEKMEVVNGIDDIGVYDDELTKQVRLKTTNRITLATTYEKARKIVSSKNIQSKAAYYELCERDNRLSIEPDIVFKSQFTNWIDYLGIPRVYYDLETCRKRTIECLANNPDIKKHYIDISIVCSMLCKIDELFPPDGLWVEYYNVNNLRDIITITSEKKRRGVIL